MARRMFYVEEVKGGRAVLTGETANHLRRVLRAEEGQQYEIAADGSLYLAEIASFGRETIHFNIVAELPVRPQPVNLHLYLSLIKFDHFESVLEKATELGVSGITPVFALRSEKGLFAAAQKRAARWE